ncbi:hypothetical protein [Subtercola vilae]|uniref:hypothetical protein n=1 Tax=Subtercola vilae TaxID=2056433 RepID=UPI0010AA0E7F|nr:hypothetical protein [Subtercola vilae]
MTNGLGRSCARCDRSSVRFATTWPEGRICRKCYQTATRIHGTCPTCRLLPGLTDGIPCCVDCAGIPKDFHCTRCNREDEPVRQGLCAHCCLTDDLTIMLDDGTGRINPALHVLFTALTTQEHARSARIWLIVNPDVTELLRALATGTAPLKHDTFTRHPSRRKSNSFATFSSNTASCPPTTGTSNGSPAGSNTKSVPQHRSNRP